MTVKEMLKEYSNQDLFTNGKSIEEYITEFAKLKCKEQRELCAENAKLKMEEPDIRQLENIHYYGADIESTYIVDINSIINSPEPEI